MRSDANPIEPPPAGVAARDSGLHDGAPADATGEPALKSTLFGVGPTFGASDRSRALPGSNAATFIGPAPVGSAGLFSTPSIKSTLMGPTPVTGDFTVSPPSIKSTLVGPAAPPPPAVASVAPVAGVELSVDAVFANAFKVVRTMARGRTSTLYEAALQGVGKRYALKVLRRTPGVDEQALQRFVHDARVASRVESAHLVEVTRAGYDGASECPWVAMELLEGETLAARLEHLEAGAAPPADEAWRVLTGVCRGLAKAHQQGVVHGDLRPSNVFLAKAADGPFEVKLVDFGTAHLVDTSYDDGGPAAVWRAPELASREVTPAADVWSLGLLAFLIFTGRSYWEGTDPAAPLDRRVVPASARAAALGCAARLPAGFDAWFAQCVARIPAARFPAARELGAALATVLTARPPEHVLDYTPARGASTASTPPPARTVTTRPSALPLERGERPARSAFAPPAARPPVPRAPRSPIHAPLTQADAPAAPQPAPPRSAVITQSAVRAATPSGNPAPLQSARASVPPGTPSPANGVRSSAPGFPSVMPGARASAPPANPSPANGVRGATPAFPTPMHGMPPATAPGLSLSSGATGSGSHRAATTSGSHRAATTSGAQRTLTTSGAQSSLTASGAQRALSVQFAQTTLAGRPSSADATPFALRPTAPPPAAPAPQHTKLLVLMGFVLGSLASLALALVIVVRQGASAAAPVVEAAAAQPLGTAPAPLVGAARRWNGTLTTDDAHWAFVLSLRVRGTTATGWFSWRAVNVPGARAGMQVRENLEGEYDAATGAYELHGTASTNPSLLPVNAYRLRATPDGPLTGTTLDASSRIEAAPESRGGR